MNDSPQPSPNPDAFGPDHTPYNAIGGEAPVRKLIDRFYDHMDEDPAFATIRQLHPTDLSESRRKLFMFFSGWLGGPQLYIEAFGHPRLRARHMPFPIGDVERDQWLACMSRAMDDCDVSTDLRQFLTSRLTHTANFMRNRE